MSEAASSLTLSEHEIARMISAAERGESPSADLESGHAQIIGITGPPGCGKSTLVDTLTAQVRDAGRTAAILAVDPSSPLTGGAVLGDRVRMSRHSTDSGVYIRSMGTRGSTRGLAIATREAVRVLDGAGYDVVILETVGVGQVELEVAGLADTVVVVTVPGLGDTIQMNKAGLMEVGDLFVVNMADRPEARRCVRELKQALAIGRRNDRMPPICLTVALTGDGVPELWRELRALYEAMSASDALVERRQRHRLVEFHGSVSRIVQHQVDHRLSTAPQAQRLAGQLQRGEVTPARAAREFVRAEFPELSAAPTSC